MWETSKEKTRIHGDRLKFVEMWTAYNFTASESTAGYPALTYVYLFAATITKKSSFTGLYFFCNDLKKIVLNVQETIFLFSPSYDLATTFYR